MHPGNKSRAKAPETPGQNPPAPVEADDVEMTAKADEIRTTYGEGIKGALKSGKMLGDYQAKLTGRGLFKKFYKEHLRWPKTRVYRLIDADKFFSHLPDATLGMFDLSALYTLSGEDAKAARAKAIKKVDKGQFITNAVANLLLGRKNSTSTTPGTVRVSKKKLNAEAKKLDLDAKLVIELLSRLGVGFDWLGKKPNKGAKPTKVTAKRREVA